MPVDAQACGGAEVVDDEPGEAFVRLEVAAAGVEGEADEVAGVVRAPAARPFALVFPARFAVAGFARPRPFLELALDDQQRDAGPVPGRVGGPARQVGFDRHDARDPFRPPPGEPDGEGNSGGMADGDPRGAFQFRAAGLPGQAGQRGIKVFQPAVFRVDALVEGARAVGCGGDPGDGEVFLPRHAAQRRVLQQRFFQQIVEREDQAAHLLDRRVDVQAHRSVGGFDGRAELPGGRAGHVSPGRQQPEVGSENHDRPAWGGGARMASPTRGSFKAPGRRFRRDDGFNRFSRTW
ncbi:MAG: hypothetical protein U1G05_11980 [Kiritimatiellia bacterium]